MVASVQPLDPVAFNLGPITVQWYGLIIAVGALLGYLLANREADRRGLPKDTLADLLIFALPISIISARLYYVIFHWQHYAGDLGRIIAIWEGGLAIHGGLIGAVITAVVFAKKRGLSFWKLADITAPSILLGQAIGRWGNFMNQEAHGGEVSRSFLENLMLPDFIIDQMFIDGVYYHPTFLYESLWNIVGVVLLLLLRRMNLRRGELFLTYVIWYSVGRFFIEGMRTDSLMMFDVLRTAQVMSVLLIIGAIGLLIYRRKEGLANIRYLDEETKKSKNNAQKGKKKK
ncbi:prolipoprotein diacylglyceryl transferase [Texcoconibacillus texcoconensis]|uniref:Phosphatidylglycerol--prolipoprotein diacylglyceryl transferase n=1 Tax=Texcoconibacillus texcoconensis TaxID=1095777 RepID=A0A840QPU4_9BACI|nr:prolipoprotein diacylglyceryl transferase [Texcoconibacillus texcoconensis]MBB5173436.1 phosphatidylglycerol:prolipoprotein diacylglycerol transferase [Texcoconibacillus texcoconensis]